MHGKAAVVMAAAMVGAGIGAGVGAGPAAAQTAPTVRIDTGSVRGVADGDVEAFKGIPFAQPPVGPLRWRAPQPVAGWPGVRAADRYGADCMQRPFPSDAAPLGTAPAEDCLFLNVWRPRGESGGGKRPVLVWIYGGGFVNGGASPPTYAGAALARRGIVFVSFNYRLGRFGSFAHPQLTAEAKGEAGAGDYGYLDQVAALRWVRRNIARFGGDPAAVTIVGESAGGMSVHAMLTSPLARGLFARAVIQSGGPGIGSGTTLAQAEAAGVAFAGSKGIAATDPQALARLRALPADAIVDGLNLETLSAQAGATPRTYTGPIDVPAFPADVASLYAAGRFAHVPVMVGATSDDIGGPTGMMASGAAKTAALMFAAGVPVYRYRFSYVAESARTSATQGAAHATDIPFFFDTQGIKYGAATSARDRAAGRLASSYLLNFVRTGDPNGAALPHWPAYTQANGAVLDMTADGAARVDSGLTAAP